MGGDLGKHVHVNTWPWSRAMEPGGSVGGGGGGLPSKFPTPKSDLFFSRKCPFLCETCPF